MRIIDSVYKLIYTTLLIHLYKKNVTDFRETVINVDPHLHAYLYLS